MRILVVEDEHRIADTVRKGLVQEGYATDVAYDGTSGYDLASAEEYDVIILDIMLPGMSGIDICLSLRKEKNHTPILLLTAKGQTADKVAGLNSGADDYLAKPFAFDELLARIRALLRRPAAFMPPTITVKDISLNPQTFVCRRCFFRRPEISGIETNGRRSRLWRREGRVRTGSESRKNADGRRGQPAGDGGGIVHG